MATPEITGAEYLARALDAYGVTAAFFVPTILSRTPLAVSQPVPPSA